MPLLSTAMKGFIALKAASKAINGTKFTLLAGSIASASCKYVLASAMVTSTNVALGPGSGTQTGKVSGLSEMLMSSLMTLKAASSGLTGRDIQKLFSAVSFGVVQGMKTALLQGTLVGAGPGSGTGKIINLVPSALTVILMGLCAGQSLSGQKLQALCSAISFGICNHIMINGLVTVTDIGVAAGPPAGPVSIPALPGIGRLV